MADDQSKSFWVTLPGILTGIAGLITAVSGSLVVYFNLSKEDNTLNYTKPIAAEVVSSSKEEQKPRLLNVSDKPRPPKTQVTPTQSSATPTQVSATPTLSSVSSTQITVSPTQSSVTPTQSSAIPTQSSRAVTDPRLNQRAQMII